MCDLSSDVFSSYLCSLHGMTCGLAPTGTAASGDSISCPSLALASCSTSPGKDGPMDEKIVNLGALRERLQRAAGGNLSVCRNKHVIIDPEDRKRGVREREGQNV